MRWKLKIGESSKEVAVELKKVSGNRYFFEVDGEEVILTDPVDFPFSLKTNELKISLESWSDKKWRAVSGSRTYTVLPQGFGEQGLGGQSQILSEMPGRILKIAVKEGQEVSAGDTLLIIEAMKMENEIRAESAATVRKIFVEAGATVESSAPLIELESPES